jgi:hypothetical protein
MNPKHEQQLEASVQRELSALGELQAPGSLAARVMGAIAQRAAVPWYHRAWQTWPVAWQTVSLAVLLAMFGGLCFGILELSQAASGSAAGQQVSGWLAGLGVLWKTAGVVVDAFGKAIQQLGMGVIVGFVLVLAVGYAACFGLGTAYVRFAMARRQGNEL